ncbi:unnamed protein product [Protopolystoma xenopodis]|uniref:Uncharacterized protein n=1 Tax=Protopolystoma xenopodis TaxID=117903 RepID=A0A3S5CEQ1_9PLAT|nr:unnamed protein product [Protopolystoma xenopodis]
MLPNFHYIKSSSLEGTGHSDSLLDVVTAYLTWKPQCICTHKIQHFLQDSQSQIEAKPDLINIPFQNSSCGMPVLEAWACNSFHSPLLDELFYLTCFTHIRAWCSHLSCSSNSTESTGICSSGHARMANLFASGDDVLTYYTVRSPSISGDPAAPSNEPNDPNSCGGFTSGKFIYINPRLVILVIRFLIRQIYEITTTSMLTQAEVDLASQDCG